MKTEMEKWSDAYFNDWGDRYKNHVSKFIDYLKSMGKADTPNNITLDDVHNCIGYYVKIGTLGAISTMELHLESLKDFYDYLLKTGKSRDIFSQMDYEEFKLGLSTQFQLAEKVSRETFSNETVIDILSKIDNYLDNDYFSLKGSLLQKRYLHRSALRIFIKLTLIAPAKRQVICSLKYNDFGEDLRTVIVNEVELSIPNSLRRDIKNAIELKKKISQKDIKENEMILKYIIGSNFNEEDLNRWFCSFIKEQDIVGIYDIGSNKDTYPIEPIMKTAISNLVKGQANLAYVSKVCGIKIGSLEENYKKEIFESKQIQPTVGESIGWETRKNPYYSYI